MKHAFIVIVVSIAFCSISATSTNIITKIKANTSQSTPKSAFPSEKETESGVLRNINGTIDSTGKRNTTDYCPFGYSNRESKKGKTVSKRGRITEKMASSQEECSTMCDDSQFCLSFEFQFAKSVCKLNFVRDVDEGLAEDSVFCIKWLCPVGYRPRAGAGMGDLNSTQMGLSLKECGRLCNETNDCQYIEFSQGEFCNDTGFPKSKRFCEKKGVSRCSMKRKIESTTEPIVEYQLCEKLDNKASLNILSRSIKTKLCGGKCEIKNGLGECKFPFKYNGKEYSRCIPMTDSEPSCAIQINEKKEMLAGGHCKDNCKDCDFTVCKKDQDCPEKFYCVYAQRNTSSRRVFGEDVRGGCVPDACKEGCPEKEECSRFVCTKLRERCVPFRTEINGTIYFSCTDIHVNRGIPDPNKRLWCATKAADNMLWENWEWCSADMVCTRGLDNYISNNTHRYATDNDIEASKIAFGSCIKIPTGITGKKQYEGVGDAFWKHVRSVKPDAWLWIGDNTYDDTDEYTETHFSWDTGTLRMQYNRVREEPSYAQYGMVAKDENGDQIPVMGVWDDHDAGNWDNYNNDNMGIDKVDKRPNECKWETQDDFVSHFNIPKTDPIHRDYKGKRQVGVYNARMFLKPGSKEPGIHVILLDVRSGRDATKNTSYYGKCRGINTQQLNNKQWDWFDNELSKKSEVKIIGSGIQVLPPSNQTYDGKITDLCAHDIHSNPGADKSEECVTGNMTEYCKAIADVGENNTWIGTKYESWGLIPQERRKLLQKAQMAINKGMAKVVIFISGDQHWGEIMAKKMPPIPNTDEDVGKSQMLYEITASGIYQQWPADILNSNRFENGIHKNIKGRSNLSTICTNSTFHTCTSKAHYGLISVDFEKKVVQAGIITPVDGNEEAFIEIPY